MPAHPLTLLLMPWGRVGSNMVNAALSELRVGVFNETLTGIESRNAGQPQSVIVDAQITWLSERLAPQALDGPTFLNHAAISTPDPGRMREWIRHRSPQLVTLDRADDAAVALSSARAEAWIAQGQASGEKRNWSISRRAEFRPRIDPEILRRNLEIVREGRRIMAGLVAGLPVLGLYYEDLVADMAGAMAAILRQAGIGWGPFSIRTSRFGSDRLAQMVANPDELAAVIRKDGAPTRLIL